MPAVSVIVPVHNAAKHLQHTLDSLLAQTLEDIEIICVDDGSTDGSRAILEACAARHPHVKVIPGPASGSAGAARNAGLEVAVGDYLSFLDADDIFAPSLLAGLYQKARAHDADVVVTKFKVLDERTGDISSVDWPLRTQDLPKKLPFRPIDAGPHLFLATNPAAWNKLFRADSVRAHGLRFQSLHSANDVFFSFMALAHAERISYWNAYPITYRWGNTGSLQGSKHSRPLEFVEALRAMRTHLQQTGRYEQFERPFNNVALDLCLANLRGAATLEAFEVLHPALVGEVLPEFGLVGRPPGYFVRPALVKELDDLLSSTPLEYAFARWQLALDANRNSQAEARSSLRLADLRSRVLDLAADGVAPAKGRPAPAADADTVDVSVIIPVHNTQAYVRECVASVLAQTGVSVEVICVDDGSDDASGEVLADIAAADQRVRLLTQANAGPSVARNVGIDAASGRYLCFVDSDDYWSLDGLAELVADADDKHLDALLFDATSVRHPDVDDKTWARFDHYYERGERYGEVVSGPQLLARMVKVSDYRASACLYLIRRDVLDGAGVRFYPGISYEDNLFSLQVMLSCGRVRHTPVRLYTRRVRPGSRMTASSRTAVAHGFFVNYVEMIRYVQGRSYPPAIGTEIGRVIYSMQRHARDHFVRLGPDVADRFGQIDPLPDAQALFHMLKRNHREAQVQRSATGRAAAPASPLRRLRRLLGRGKRAVLRRLGR